MLYAEAQGRRESADAYLICFFDTDPACFVAIHFAEFQQKKLIELTCTIVVKTFYERLHSEDMTSVNTGNEFIQLSIPQHI